MNRARKRAQVGRAPMARKKKEESPPKFEEALEELEKIVEDLEGGELGLDESLQRYERGVKAYRRCYEILEGAERRIALLTGKDPDGNPITEPFEHQSTVDRADQTGSGEDSVDEPDDETLS